MSATCLSRPEETILQYSSQPDDLLSETVPSLKETLGRHLILVTSRGYSATVVFPVWLIQDQYLIWSRPLRQQSSVWSSAPQFTKLTSIPMASNIKTMSYNSLNL